LPTRRASFPTRRSSDLFGTIGRDQGQLIEMRPKIECIGVCDHLKGILCLIQVLLDQVGQTKTFGSPDLHNTVDRCCQGGLCHKRSEEHTSELQSRENLV